MIFALFPLFYFVTLQMFPIHESDTVTNPLFFYSSVTIPKLRKFQEAASGKRGKMKGKGEAGILIFLAFICKTRKG